MFIKVNGSNTGKSGQIIAIYFMTINASQLIYAGLSVNLSTLKREKVMDLLRILIAILLPPLGVFLQVGLSKTLLLNIILTLLGYIPGIVHAVWVIAKR